MLITLTNGLVTLVDDIDYDFLLQWRWNPITAHKVTHAIATDRVIGSVYAHRLIAERMGLDVQGKLVNHKNLIGLDNRRENLRLCNQSQNKATGSRYVNNISGYRGVSFHKDHGRFRANIRFLGRSYHLGYFDTKEEAAQAYNEAAIRFFGEFAALNLLESE